MKKLIRLTESELKSIIGDTVQSLLGEDVLGDDWMQREEDDNVMNNYEPFQSQKQNNVIWDDDDDNDFSDDEYDRF